ncbi:MAG TPA: hypothetical protein VLA34_08140, partial [Candidatus Krumholzibacterium sp.]|nr:hypothetical protein [Candidatus Krumholzibacterium sp.]
LSALHQCMRGGRSKEVKGVVLTASGGPFWREGPPANARVRDVLQHPTWRMGRKITVDSATMMNKGLEVIETARLFSLKPEQIRVVIHPQSIVHSFVEFVDGSLLAQVSRPDMRLPIQYALTYPDRVPSLAGPLDVRRMGAFDFVSLRPGKFGCFDLARKALVDGPAATCVLNAANQVVVEAFLAGRVVFGDIPTIIRRAVASSLPHAGARPAFNPGIKTLLGLEARAVDCAVEQIRRTAARRSRSAGRR